MTRYVPPKLNSHKVIWKGKRYWLFEISKDNPFEGHEEYCSLIFYDKFIEASVGFGNKDTLTCKIPVGPYELEAKGKTPKELAHDAVATLAYIERMGY